MLRLAITGGLCSGKSTVAALLRERGCPIVDADRVAHALLQGEAKPAVVARFGASILDANGAVLPARLAECVFAPGAGAELAHLNHILHPLVMGRAEAQMRDWEEQGRAVGGVDAALLMEAGLLAGFDHVVVVTADWERRVERFMARSGGSREQALARLAQQLPDACKVKQANTVIENNSSPAALVPQVERLLRRLGVEVPA